MQIDFRISNRAAGPVSRLLGTMAVALLAGACSVNPGLQGIGASTKLASAAPVKSEPAGKTELNKAIEYWGAAFKKNPHSLKAALSYARNLKAAGRKKESFGVIQSAALLHGDSRELASEYGRLALDLGQVQVAEKVLAMADDPAKPDWRVISARGTVLAKQGKYSAAIPFYERALALSPGEVSVLNNLALVYAADGEPAKGEKLLREVAAKSDDPKVRQNLALVLGLQGKYNESQKQGSKALPVSVANANTEYLRRLVKAPAVEPANKPVVTVAAASAPVMLDAAAVIARAQSAEAKKLRSSKGPNAVGAGTSNWGTALARN